MQFVDKDLKSIQEARILVESARDAHQLLSGYSQEDLNKIVHQLIDDVSPIISELLDGEVEKTKSGVKEDKLKLYNDMISKFSSEIDSDTVIGVLEENSQKQIEKFGVSLGTIVALLPNENAILNSFFALLIAIKSGNALVLVPQKEIVDVITAFYNRVSEICASAGLPQGIFSYMQSTTPQGVKEIVSHPDTARILNIGCPEFFDHIESANKPVMFAGTGSTPVFIERSANIEAATQEIIDSRSFDNGLLPAAEQYVIAEGVVSKEVKSMLVSKGAHFMTKDEEKSLIKTLFVRKDEVDPIFVGKSAKWIAQRAGFNVETGTKVLVSEQPYIFDENPFANNLKCPIMAYYLEPDWMHACEKCIYLLREKKNGHTLVIHSNNADIVREFAIKKPVGRMIVNNSATFASMGINSDLPLSMFLGGLTTGRGYVSKNVVAKDLTYVREISYTEQKSDFTSTTDAKDFNVEKEVLEKLLKKILEQ
jgi:NAD-dependent aldehyde dehydrogenases